MVRQISFSAPPNASASVDTPDLGRWLTRELRVKGTPLPSQPPPSAPPSSHALDSERASLAGWLARDLVPKHSVRPSEALVRRSLRPSDPATEPPSAPTSWNGAEFASGPSSEEVDSAAPASGRSESSWASPMESSARHPLRSTQPLPVHAFAVASRSLGEAPLASAPPAADVVLAKTPMPSALVALEDDDLSVLPGRRRAASGSGRAKLAVGLLLGLVALGVGLVVQLGGDPSRDTRAAASGGPAADMGALLPPPPTSAALLDTPPEVAATASNVRRRSGGAEEPEEAEGLLDPRDPRFRLGGPSVRRYADVPSPTLSRLAQEQRRLAREREQALRKAKSTSTPKP